MYDRVIQEQVRSVVNDSFTNTRVQHVRTNPSYLCSSGCVISWNFINSQMTSVSPRRYAAEIKYNYIKNSPSLLLTFSFCFEQHFVVHSDEIKLPKLLVEGLINLFPMIDELTRY